MMKNLNTWFLFFGAMAIMVYLVGAACIDVMNIDSAHYAEMAREMSETGKYFEIKNRMVDDYLDKPPLIFWLSSLVYYLFGASVFTFRIPALLAAILGGYSVYRFTRLYHDKGTGLLAMVILLSSQVYFLYNHNFLTDTLLANLAIFSIWQLAEYLEGRRLTHFIGAFAGLTLAMMSKGPLGLMVPVTGFFVHFIYKRQWTNILRREWLAGGILIIIFLIPMLIGLYRQYGEIGLQFFFWTQSFGRITGQSHWHDQSSSFYFVHTFLWFFLPWSFIALYALARNIKHMILRTNSPDVPEVISTGGFILSFLVLSLSRYKLPQYIFVLMPLAAAFSAPVAMDLIRGKMSGVTSRWLTLPGYVISSIYWLGIAGIMIFVFPGKAFVAWMVFFAGIGMLFMLFIRGDLKSYRPVLPLALTVIMINLLLNIQFYPNLMYYQTGDRIAKEWKKHEASNSVGGLFYYKYHSPALDFHLGQAPAVINKNKLERLIDRQGQVWVVTNQEGRDDLLHYIFAHEKAFESYPVQALSLPFLNKATRKEKLGRDYLLQLK